MISPYDEQVRPLLFRAGDEALKLFGQVQARHKADGSPVTVADKISEEILVTGLEAAFPDDAIQSEEGLAETRGERQWYIDPLDGTGSFIEGLAHWGPTLGLVVGDEPLYGALYLPRTGDYFYAEGGEAWLNDEKLGQLSEDEPSRRAILYIPSRIHAYVRLDWPGKARNLGSIAGHMSLVAAGGASGALVPGGWQPWDVACGLALLSAVGGIARTFSGEPLSIAEHGGQPFIAGSPGTVRWMLAAERLQFFSD
jgi:myo-inositol-1(or 4)-monophosphatase